MWLICPLISIFTGWTFVYFVRGTHYTVVVHSIASWLVGTSITGTLLTIAHQFFEFSVPMVSSVLGFEAFCAITLLSWAFIHKPTHLALEKRATLLLCILLGGLISFLCSKAVFDPEGFPTDLYPLISHDRAVVNSIVNGCNLKASKIFRLADPFLFNATIGGMPTFYEYTAACQLLGGEFPQILKLFGFMNGLAIGASIYFISVVSSPKRKFTAPFAILLVLMNGGWASIKNMSMTNGSLIQSRTSPFYQVSTTFLCSSINSSFTLALSMLAMAFLWQPQKRCFIIASILTSSIPSLFPYLGVLSLAICSINVGPIYFSSLVTAPLLILSAKIHAKPIWREAQMDGYFYTQVSIWFHALGPVFFLLIPAVVCQQRKNRIVTALSFSFLLCLFRDSNTPFQTILTFASTAFPLLAVYGCSALQSLIDKFKGKGKGILWFTLIAIVLFSTYGAVLEIKQTANARTFGYPNGDYQTWFNAYTTPKETILTPPITLPPIIDSGRQAFLALPLDVWINGNDPIPLLTKYRVEFNENCTKFLNTNHIRYVFDFRSYPVIKNLDDLFTVLRTDENYALLTLK